MKLFKSVYVVEQNICASQALCNIHFSLFMVFLDPDYKREHCM